MGERIVRMSIRTVAPLMEFRVKEIMSKVERTVRQSQTPGLDNIETLVDRHDPNRYLIVTEWRSRADLDAWLKSPLCKQAVAELATVLESKNVEYREFTKESFVYPPS